MNRNSRKPFYWGGLKGYEQLEAIAQVLRSVPAQEAETSYLRQLARQADRAVEKNHTLAQDVREAHTWLERIADCLRYPPAASSASDLSGAQVTGEQVSEEMEKLLREFRPDLKRRPAQAALYHTSHRLWKEYGPDLLHCYDVPGLPPDNLKLEAFFGRLRCHQGVSVGANPRASCATLNTARSYSWPKVRRFSCSNSARFPWPTIKFAVVAWLKLKCLVSSFVVCIAIRCAPCAIWLTSMPPVGLRLHPVPACRRQ